MHEIITLNKDGVAVVDTITIAEGVQVQHKNILELIRKYLPDFEAFGPVAFETRKGKPLPQGGFAKATEVAWLTEDQTTLLFTFLKNTEIARKLKIRLVKAFREAREEIARLQQTPTLPDFTNPAIAARAWAEQYEKNQALIEQSKIDAPKVKWCDRVIAANEHMTITQAAKTLGYPPRKFKDYLRQIGFIYTNADTPMQEQIKTGRAVLRYAHYTSSEGNPVEKPYTHITSKGLKWLYEKLVNDGLIERQQDLFEKTA
jgi:phage antirepressor YoqD-like protein|nr:MAG TPA: KilAC domain protein [Caudoviricetes sp.]